jgi:hypothetical protein
MEDEVKFLVIISALTLFGCNIPYGDGSRVGVIKKLSKRGFFCKTWEGEMLLSADNVMQPETWSFSIDSDAVAAQVKENLVSGKRVELVYKQIVMTTPCSPDSGYRILEVK